jgi:hypothetical protein
MLTDLDPLALHFIYQYWIAAGLVCSFWEAMAGTLSVASTAVLSEYCRQRMLWCILVRLVGLQCIVGIIMALGHFLGVCQHWLRVLYTLFQLLQGSVCYANSAEGETGLAFIGVQYAILCWRLERCLKMLQISIACFQELHLSFIRFDVSVLLWSASVWSWTDDWVLIHYFQPLGGSFLRDL